MEIIICSNCAGGEKGLDDEKLILVFNVLPSFVFEESLVVPLEDKIRKSTKTLRHVRCWA